MLRHVFIIVGVFLFTSNAWAQDFKSGLSLGLNYSYAQSNYQAVSKPYLADLEPTRQGVNADLLYSFKTPFGFDRFEFGMGIGFGNIELLGSDEDQVLASTTASNWQIHLGFMWDMRGSSFGLVAQYSHLDKHWEIKELSSTIKVQEKFWRWGPKAEINLSEKIVLQMSATNNRLWPFNIDDYALSLGLRFQILRN